MLQRDLASRALLASSALVALLATAGCATPSPPTLQIDAARRAIASAVDSGAGESTPARLSLAQEKMRLAGRFAESGDYRPAKWLAEQARADADLARATTRLRAAWLAMQESRSGFTDSGGR